MIDGQHRYEVAKALKLGEIPVEVVDAKDKRSKLLMQFRLNRDGFNRNKNKGPRDQAIRNLFNPLVNDPWFMQGSFQHRKRAAVIDLLVIETGLTEMSISRVLKGTQTRTKNKKVRERRYYSRIRTKLESIIGKKLHIEITAYRSFSSELRGAIHRYGRPSILRFVKKNPPDITGFVQGSILIAEIKDAEIKIDDVYQTKKYADLLNAKYALLISTKEIPVSIKRVSKTVDQLLSRGYDHRKVTLVHFDPKKDDFVDWFEGSPFNYLLKRI